MLINWHGLNYFTLKGKDITVALDPHDPNTVNNADIVIISQKQSQEYYKKKSEKKTFLIHLPGEYEISDVYVKAIKINKEKMIFTINMDDLKICHLSDVNEELSDEMTEEIGNVDILCIPVGGKEVYTAEKAHKAIENIDPKVVIPMHYYVEKVDEVSDSINEFLKEVGHKEIEPIDSLKIQKSGLPSETTEFKILLPQIR